MVPTWRPPICPRSPPRASPTPSRSFAAAPAARTCRWSPTPRPSAGSRSSSSRSAIGTCGWPPSTTTTASASRASGPSSRDRAQAALVGRLLDVLDDLERLVADGASASAEQVRQAVDAGGPEAPEGAPGRRAGAHRPGRRGRSTPACTRRSPRCRRRRPSSDHQVSATFQAGYRFKGALVRPARVQVYAEQGQA